MRYVTSYAFPLPGAPKPHVDVLYRGGLGINQYKEPGGQWIIQPPLNRGVILTRAIAQAVAMTGDGPIAVDIEPWASVRARALTSVEATRMLHAVLEAISYATGRPCGILGDDDDPAAFLVCPMVYCSPNPIDPDRLVKLDASTKGKNITPFVWDRYAYGPKAGKPVSDADLKTMVEAVARYAALCNGSATVVGWSDARTADAQAAYSKWFSMFEHLVTVRSRQIGEATTEQGDQDGV